MGRKVTSICCFFNSNKGEHSCRTLHLSILSFLILSYPQTLKDLVSDGRVDFAVKTLFTQEGGIPELFKKFIL